MNAADMDRPAAPNRPANRGGGAIALATTAWLAVSAALWVASDGGCIGDCHELSAAELRNSSVLAMLAVIVLMLGPALVALLAFRFGQVRNGIVYLAVSVVLAALILLSPAATFLLDYDWPQSTGGP